jgi:hypothetical protein
VVYTVHNLVTTYIVHTYIILKNQTEETTFY